MEVYWLVKELQISDKINQNIKDLNINQLSRPIKFQIYYEKVNDKK